MANHRAAALLIASLLVAVAVADARFAAKHYNARFAANAKHHNARFTIHRDARGGRHAEAAQHTLINYSNANELRPMKIIWQTIRSNLLEKLMVSLAVLVVSDAPAVPALSCSTVHGVQEGETCFSVAQGAGLTQDDFLGFNPNINCKKVFVGQWVCLAAVPAA
jgi:hypothetical protein